MGLSLPRLSAAFLLACLSVCAFSQAPTPTPSVDPRDTLAVLAEQERQRTADPATGTVPYERLAEAREQLIRQSATTPSGAPGTGQVGIPNVTWQERGPSNVGGRIRTLLFDPNDATRKKVWAGSPAGGLWFTTDITDANAVWTPVSDLWENLIVTALAADPSNPQIMYAGTGSFYNGTGGGGIWKTSNGGTTWARLSSSIPNSSVYGSVNNALTYIQRIVVNSSGQVFAATQYGLLRSTDGGGSWAFALAPNQGVGAGTNTGNAYNDRVTDLEIGADGILYAALDPSRVFRATDASGTTWIEITPPGIIGERTEIALAPSTSGTTQVIYGVSRKYNSLNYGQDITWFKKSTDGGSTWTNVAIPIPSGSTSHFTYGNGYSYLNLAVSPTDPNTVYAGSSGWFRSTNGGASWGSNQSGYGNQQGLWFQPGNAVAAVFATETGVFWSADWGNTAVTSPAYSQRTTDLRIGEVVSASMKPAPGGSSLLAGIKNLGYQQITGPGLSTGISLYGTGGGSLLNFIDTDDPTLQIIQSYNVFLRYGTNGSTQLVFLNTYGTPTPADYDSQANTFYVADYNSASGQYVVRRVTGVDTSPQSTTFAVPGLSNSYPGYFKLNAAGTTLLVGNYPGKLFKITNLSQPTPTIVTIDNGAFPQYSSISCIDVGSNDNELLVTLSNYGVASVWYTNNGGDTWTNKDQTNFGLPDVPVRTALFNPTSRKQVLLGTDVGIWSTDDIIAPNPGWQYTGGGMVPVPINQLRYRASDGRVTAATNGRGVWQTDALAVPYTPSTLAITNVSNSLLCAGNTFSVSYNASGSAFSGTPTVEVWLSDATGNFANQRRVATGTSNPISVTLPAINAGAYAYGTNYRVRLVAPAQDIASEQSGPLAIGDLWNAFATDRTGGYGGYWSSNSICSGGRAKLTVYSRGSNNVPTGADGYGWTFNGAPVSGVTSQTLLAQQAGNYQATVKQAGCTVQASLYTLNFTANPYANVAVATSGLPQCSDSPQTLRSSYAGEGTSYQWQRDGTNIAGATADTFATAQSGAYSFRLTDGSCTPYTTTKQILTFGSSLYARLSRSPGADTVLCPGSYNSTYLTTDVLSSNATTAKQYTVQWYRNNTVISNATQTYYFAYQPGSYTFELKQGSCSTRSNAQIITEGTSIATPTITNSSGISAGQTACPGETRYLNASGSSGNYQWQRDGIDIAGATGSQYAAQTSGNYTCRISRNSCQATSAPFSLTFTNAIQPGILTNNGTGGVGCTSNFIQYASSGTLSGVQYQWFRDGVAVSSTNSYLSATVSGSYTVRVTSGACTGLSQPVMVQIGQASKPILTTGSRPQGCVNNAIQLNVSGYQGSLQWKRNGVIISGSTSYQFFATESGLYTVVHQDGSCTAESDPIAVKIGEPTSATLTGPYLAVSGQTTTLPITFSGPAPWSVSLTSGLSASAIFQNPYSFSVAPASSTTYQLASVYNACGSGTISGLAVVTVGSAGADISLAMSVSNRTPHVDEPVEFIVQVNNAGPLEATGVRVSSRLPPNMTFVDALPGVSFASDSVRIEVVSISVGNTLTFRFRAKATQPGVFISAAQVVAATTPDPDSQPDSGTEDGQDDAAIADIRTPDAGLAVFVSPNPRQKPLPPVQDNQPPTEPMKSDLSLSMAASTLTPRTGEVFSLSLTISNRGGAWVAAIQLEMLLPNGWEMASTTNVNNINGQTVQTPLFGNGTPPTGQNTQVFLVRANQSGTVKAQILAATPGDSDSILGNGYDYGEDDEAQLSLRVLN